MPANYSRKVLTPNQNEKLQQILSDTYNNSKVRNNSFSMRSFCKKIGVSSGALSEILKSKRTATILTARKILKNLNYTEDQIETFLTVKKSKQQINRFFQELNNDQYEIVSNWQYTALLNFIELPNESHSAASIASRLGFSSTTVNKLLKKLESLGLIEKKERRFYRTFIRYRTSEDIANSAIKDYHLKAMDLNKKALINTEIQLRDFSSVFLQMHPSKLKEIKKIIRNFESEICELVEDEDPKEVYVMNIQVYPLTKKLR